MTTIAQITGIFRNNIGESVFSELTRIYPQGQTGSHGHAFWSSLTLDDPRTTAILSVLRRHGYQPWLDHSKLKDRQKEYTLELSREYETSDFAGLELVELSPKAYIEGLFRTDDEGLIRLDGRDLKPNADFATAGDGRYVVPEHTKVILESADLPHVVFRPTLLGGGNLASDMLKPIAWELYGEPWWELTSDYELPAVSSSMKLVNENNQPVADGSHGCYRRDNLFVHPELHYRASDLSKAELFALALTHEYFGGVRNKCSDRVLVASKRFYELCQQHQLKADWVPVRIDPD